MPSSTYDESTMKMLDSVDFSNPSSSTTSTPRRRNRRKRSSDSVHSEDSTSTSSSSRPITRAKKKVRLQKEQRLHKFLSLSDDQLRLQSEDLKAFARSEGGLINDEIRARFWPVLAEYINQGNDSLSSSGEESSSSCSDSDFETALSSLSLSDDGGANEVETLDEEDLRGHPEWNQVQMDVHRTLTRFPPGTSEDERHSLQRDLTPLIVKVLSENKKFRYYQGFHDICLTLVLVLGTQTALRVARILAHRTVFKRYLTKSLEESAMHDLQYMYVLLFKHNRRLEAYLREAELGTLFALSWPLTWFSHVLDDYQQVVACFDLFLASDALMPVYVSAAVINERVDEVYQTDKDMPSLHHLLSRIPTTIDIPAILETATELFKEYPPRLLRTKYFEEYENECEESKKRHARVPPANTLSRYSISKWVVAGTMSAAAFYLLWSNMTA